MLDINKAVNQLESQSHDLEGNLEGLPAWSRAIAKQHALSEGLGELSDTQWRVIYSLRGMYRKQGRAENARQVIKQLESDFTEEGGRKFLYQAFPQGPVSQGSRLAGIPAPPYATDKSFGSVA
ncbi:MAG: TusE/DsrC/DsvC family sulfur relay protein [Sterolibacterium sp.]|nr:TusE/DsrC/DsvC family sulfur relay protein [Sterolibacterium sp.]